MAQFVTYLLDYKYSKSSLRCCITSHVFWQYPINDANNATQTVHIICNKYIYLVDIHHSLIIQAYNILIAGLYIHYVGRSPYIFNIITSSSDNWKGNVNFISKNEEFIWDKSASVSLQPSYRDRH